ncbi:copper-binding protein [Bradyrhizobium betae]|uniref:Copper-binding protein n=1 Tax=Bradyrhizobium betae TaxID=244734 RepID=A0A5P6P8X1_9BRAD|nr:copper-binding protein [Bradyrhizobium betae]MCS3727254.1 Cu/Ag efflux protein CusF [Bradyrhizobium betae]QFI74837.1 copper-binding protein [Bradyrhizobium betae]
MLKLSVRSALFAVAISVAPVAAFAQANLVTGEVKKVDEGAGKITLKHGPIKSLNMDDEEMTMVFRVSDPSMLKQVKAGDKVQFEVERQTGGITITKLQKAK